MTYQLEPGKTYNVTLKVRNDSTKGGQPAGVTMTVTLDILAYPSTGYLWLTPQKKMDVAFGPGEVKSWTYSFTTPAPGVANLGVIAAYIDTPVGRIAQTSQDIVIGVLTVPFGGTVKDAATQSGLAGVLVELIENGAVVYSAMTDSSGKYTLSGIKVPASYVFRFSKSGYQTQETISITIGIDGGALNTDLAPTAPTLYSLLPDGGPATGNTWSIYDWALGYWLDSQAQLPGEGKLKTEPYSWQPNINPMVTIQTALNRYYDQRFYGPFLLSNPGPGNYRLGDMIIADLANYSARVSGVTIRQHLNIPKQIEVVDQWGEVLNTDYIYAVELRIADGPFAGQIAWSFMPETAMGQNVSFQLSVNSYPIWGTWQPRTGGFYLNADNVS